MRQFPIAIQTIIADDHPLIRKGFKEMLEGDSEIALIAEATDGLHLLELLEIHQPHVILLDIQMPRMSGIEASRIIKERYPTIHIIALSMSDEDRFIKALWQSGAKGYLLKEIDRDELLQAIKTVHMGGSYYCKEVAERITYLLSDADDVNRRKEKGKPIFSETEVRIIRLICQGLTCKEISERMKLAIKTVEHYKERIQEKAGAKNAVEIAVYCIFNGIVKKEDLN